MKRYCVATFFCFFFCMLPQYSFSDSIKVGNKTYDDVYIKDTSSHYNIHIPKEGKVLSVSNKRMDVKVLEISDDEERASLWQAYQDKTQPNKGDSENGDKSISTDNESNEHTSVRKVDKFINVPEISVKGNMTQSIPGSYGKMNLNAEPTSSSQPDNFFYSNNNAFVPQRPSLNDFSRNIQNPYIDSGYLSFPPQLDGYGAISDITGRPKTEYVRPYTKKDGTQVRGYYRSPR